ncbi:MAG: protein TolA [Verrucomicrobia bacterium]|nr:protein TolA [Verrucomicrobiota bacterium]
MTARSPSAFFLSATLHALVIGLALLFTYLVQTQVKEQPKIFELVAGEGDNYGALEAPALGTPGGIKIALPEPPAPKPAPVMAPPVAPAPVESAPEPVVTKAPIEKTPPKTAPKPVDTKAPNFSQQIKRRIIRSESKAKAEVKKEREAEQKRLTKEEYDRQNKAARTVASTGGNPKVKRIDTAGIAGGVVGGSAGNKTGGAGGKALARDEGDLMDAYFSLLKRKLKEALDKPPGLADSLTAVAEFHLGADGSVSGAHISQSSGSEEFDKAVLEAVGRYRSIGARPDHKGETVNVTFRMKEEDE